MKKKSINRSFNKNLFLNNLSLKKKYFYSHIMNSYISKLQKSLNEKQKVNSLNSILTGKNSKYKKHLNDFSVSYIIYFSFSTTNTFMYITDSLGNLKHSYSAGSVEFKGKQKKVRILVLTRFLKELRKLKMSTLKNKPIALHLHNVGFYRYFIIKNIKKYFFIRLIQNYTTYSYNGCRKKKKLRKR